jgi:hypothetical protein
MAAFQTTNLRFEPRAAHFLCEKVTPPGFEPGVAD